MKKILHPVELKNISYEGNVLKFQKKLKELTFFTIAVIFCLTFFTSLTKANILKKTNVDEHWILLKNSLGIKIYYQISNCESVIVALFKFKNPTSSDLILECDKNVPKSKSVEHITFSLSAGKTVFSESLQSSIIKLLTTNNDQLPL